MTTYVSNCGSDLGEMNDVNGWGQECCSNPYKTGSNFGMEHCNFNDVDYVGYELQPPDIPTGDSWPPNLSAYYGQGMNSIHGSVHISNYERLYDDSCDYSVPKYVGVNGYIEHEVDLEYTVSDVTHMNGDYEHEIECEYVDYNDKYGMKYGANGNGSDAYTDYENASFGNDVKHEVDTDGYGHYAGFNHVDASQTRGSYAPSTYPTQHTHMRNHPYQFASHHPTSYSVHKQPQRPSRPAPYVPPHLRQYSTQRQVLPSYHKPSYMRPYHNSPSMSPPLFVPCTDFDIPNYECQNTNDIGFVDCLSYAHVNYIDELHNCPDMWERRGTGFEYVEHHVDGDEADFGDSKVAQSTASYEPPTADPLDFDSSLELCVKENEIILKDLESLRQRVNQFVEKEKCKELKASLPCLEKQKLGEDVFIVGYKNRNGNEINVSGGATVMGDSKLEESTIKLAVAIKEVSDENERKAEPSLGFKAAMRCLELQRKFWDIGSLMSVIPAVPIHHFDDPFLVKMKKDDKVPSTCAADWLRALFWSEERHIWGASEAANDWGNTHLTFTFGYELTVSLRGLPLVSWARHLQKEWIFTISGAWTGLWRPPDTIVRVYDSLVRLLVLRGFWFDRGRPPDI